MAKQQTEMLTHDQIWDAMDRLAARSGLSPSGLAQASGLHPTTFNQSKSLTPKGLPAPTVPFDPFVSLIEDTPRVVQSVPLLGFAQAGAGGYFTDGGFPAGKGWDEVGLPSVNDEHAYALEISGDSMKPAYRDGDVIVVSPGSPIRRGDRVVVKTSDGEVMVKELKRRTAKTLELSSLNPNHVDRTLAATDVAWIARMVWGSQDHTVVPV